MMPRPWFKPHPRFADTATYRADIDGLRALAVISVILFHLHSAGISGGYVGVDIFFVISGYLITHIIHRESHAGTFSFRRFYQRRIRRLAPSLLVMLMLSALFATLMLSPADLVHFARSLTASVLFVSNIFFYLDSGYFTADAETKPLLHLWSLSVEEQFYLIWPVALLVIHRIASSRRVVGMLAMVAALSIAGAIALSPRDPDAAFYLLPTRVFEFLIGASLVWIKTLPRARKVWADCCFIAGIAMVGASLFLFTNLTPFPSYHALLPCLGAALILYAGHATRLRVTLANPLIAYIGRISYELYIFHWPVIVFYQYVSFTALDAADSAIILSITAALSMATYHGIGFPLRHGFNHSVRQQRFFLLGCALLCVALLATAFAMRTDHGWPARLPAEARLFAEDPEAFHLKNFGGIRYPDNTLFTLGDPSKPPQFLIFGDSFASQYAAALSEFLAEHHQAAYGFFEAGCIVMPHIVSDARPTRKKECAATFEKVVNLLKGTSLPVIHAQNWPAYKNNLLQRNGPHIVFDKDTNDSYYRFVIDSIEKARTAFAGHRYVLMGLAPSLGVESKTKNMQAITRCFQIPTYFPNQCGTSIATKETLEYNGIEFNTGANAYVSATPDVTFLNVREAFCRDGLCYAIRDSKVFYSDGAHLSKDGARLVIDHFSDAILSLHP